MVDRLAAVPVVELYTSLDRPGLTSKAAAD